MPDEKMVTIKLRRSWLRIGIIVAVTMVVTATATAYATNGFRDVSERNIFRSDIEWLKDTGVTKGCNPPQNTMYCPRSDVTRQEMAAFMRRLAENRVVDAGSFMGNPVGDFSQDFQWTSDSSTLFLTAANDRGGRTVNCPAGTRVVTGGGRAQGDLFAVTGSYPTSPGTGWRVEFQYTGPPSNVSTPVTVFAQCARYADKSASPLPEVAVDPGMVEAVPIDD